MSDIYLKPSTNLSKVANIDYQLESPIDFENLELKTPLKLKKNPEWLSNMDGLEKLSPTELEQEKAAGVIIPEDYMHPVV